MYDLMKDIYDICNTRREYTIHEGSILDVKGAYLLPHIHVNVLVSTYDIYSSSLLSLLYSGTAVPTSGNSVSVYPYSTYCPYRYWFPALSVYVTSLPSCSSYSTFEV
jgi:hypothetical protein